MNSHKLRSFCRCSLSAQNHCKSTVSVLSIQSQRYECSDSECCSPQSTRRQAMQCQSQSQCHQQINCQSTGYLPQADSPLRSVSYSLLSVRESCPSGRCWRNRPREDFRRNRTHKFIAGSRPINTSWCVIAGLCMDRARQTLKLSCGKLWPESITRVSPM